MLSVIIATRDCERALLRTLSMLVSASVAGVVRDVVVADAGSHDETAKIAELAGCALLVSDAPLAARLREAVTAARSAWLLLLPPGSALESGWGEETARFIEDAEMRGKQEAAAVFKLQPSGRTEGSLAGQAWTLLRATLRRTPLPAQGLVISRALYQRVGGHRLAAVDPEADLLRRLGARRLVRLRSVIFARDDDPPP
jgi:hypothetical protein